MGKESNYAVRIAKLRNVGGDYIVISLGQKVNIPNKYDMLQIEISDHKIIFSILNRPSSNIKGFRNSYRHIYEQKTVKSFKLERKGYLCKCFTQDKKIIEELLDWVGEYKDCNPWTEDKSQDSTVFKKFWINKCQKESFTFMDARGNYDLKTIKKPNCIADILDSPKEEEKPIVGPIKYKCIRPTTEFPHGGLVEDPVVPVKLPESNIPREKVRELFKDLTAQAHKCTDTIQSAMADIFDYQLRKIHVTYEEANRNIKLQQILLKYIKLQDEIEEIAGYDDYKPKEGDGNVRS